MFGWTGNMERLAMSNAHQKSDDPMRSYHLSQKKTLEINPRHPVIKGKRKFLKCIIPSTNIPIGKIRTRNPTFEFNTFYYLFMKLINFSFSIHSQNCCVVLKMVILNQLKI